MIDKVTDPNMLVNLLDDTTNMSLHFKKLKEIFFDEFGTKRTTPRPKFRGKNVYVDLKEKTPFGTPKVFIHLLGFDKKDINFSERSVLACTNDPISLRCNENCIHKTHKYMECQYEDGGKKEKYLCLYRGVRIPWINQIIDLANRRSSYVRVFEEYREAKGKEITEVHLYYVEGIIHYDVILKKQGNQYILKTAFPVLHSRKKKDLERKYQEFLNKPDISN